MTKSGHQIVVCITSVLWCLTLTTLVVPSSSIDPVTTLECHRRQYSYKVQQTDSEGRTCWDHINVMSCWGRCDSNEIADWKFPYKKSHHPVCLHSSTQEKKVTLRNCDPDVEPETKIYTFQEAASCSCSFCRSSEASCEGLRYRGARRAPRQVKKSLPSKLSKYSLGNLSPQMLNALINLSPRMPSSEETSHGFQLIEVVEPQEDLGQMIDRMNDIDKNIFNSILKDRMFGKRRESEVIGQKRSRELAVVGQRKESEEIDQKRSRESVAVGQRKESEVIGLKRRRESAAVGQIPFVDASSNSNLDFLSFLDSTFGGDNDSPVEGRKIPTQDLQKENSGVMFDLKWLKNNKYRN